MLQGIVAGVGFIGAGVILHRQDGRGVEGLTTAAAIWIVAAIGVAAGAGLWRTAASALVVTLLLLVVAKGSTAGSAAIRTAPEVPCRGCR